MVVVFGQLELVASFNPSTKLNIKTKLPGTPRNKNIGINME
jgi:hypothetical protein